MLDYEQGYHAYYIYILSNTYRTTLYIGVANSLKRRLREHLVSIECKTKSFVSHYNLSVLVYYEKFVWIQEAIAREKELKKWSRSKKNELIRSFNPEFASLNHLFELWDGTSPTSK